MSEIDLLRVLGITGHTLSTAIKVGDFYVRASEIQTHLGRYALRLVSYTGDDTYQFQHFGSATGIRYQGHYFAISTDHQRKLGTNQSLGIVCDSGQSVVTPSRIWTIKLSEGYEREIAQDFAVYEFEPEKYSDRFLQSQFLKIGTNFGIGTDVGKIAFNIGYPTRLQNVDYHNEKIDLLTVSSFVKLVKKNSSKNLSVFRTISEDRFFEDGMSGSPVFEVFRENGDFLVRLLGIVVLGGENSRNGRVIDAEYIIKQIDRMIE